MLRLSFVRLLACCSFACFSVLLACGVFNCVVESCFSFGCCLAFAGLCVICITDVSFLCFLCVFVINGCSCKSCACMSSDDGLCLHSCTVVCSTCGWLVSDIFFHCLELRVDLHTCTGLLLSTSQDFDNTHTYIHTHTHIH
jgi:hypothetical protein